MTEVLAIVPARGGSKGLLRKNIRPLAGHPLVAWPISAALAANKVTRTFCSTDDEEIAEVARQYGAEVPFLRPAEFAQDNSPDLPLFIHALDWLEKRENWRPDMVVQLRPTSPLRLPGMVDETISMLEDDPSATSVRAVCPAPCNPYKMWRLTEDLEANDPYMRNLLEVPGLPEPYNAARQSLPPVWWQIGTVDTVRTSVLRAGSMTGDRILPLKVDGRIAIDIDGDANLRLAEHILGEFDCVRPGPALDWQNVRLLALDVDGTLTPGTMYYDTEGEALKRFHTHDGKGIARAREAGVLVAILTQEPTDYTIARARKLGLEEVHLGVEDKVGVLREICGRLGVEFSQVAYVGDDLGDLAVMRSVREAGGLPCAVADARPEILEVARFVCPKPGGGGAVRDVCDQIVAAKQP